MGLKKSLLGSLLVGSLVLGCNDEWKDLTFRTNEESSFKASVGESVRYPTGRGSLIEGESFNQFKYGGVSNDWRTFNLDMGEGMKEYPIMNDTLRLSSIVQKRNSSNHVARGTLEDLYFIEAVNNDYIEMRPVGCEDHAFKLLKR